MTTLTRIEWIQKYSDCLMEGLDLGMIPTNVMGMWILYQEFLIERPKHKSKHQTFLYMADIHNCDPKTIRNAVKFYG